MNILITGGAGFIGSNFVRNLVGRTSEQNKIIVIDKLTYAGNIENIQHLIDQNSIQFIKGDIQDEALLKNIIEENDTDTVVNFAAETHVDRSISGPRNFIESNILGTFSLLETIRKTDSSIRLHHISTDEVFGELPTDKKEVKFNEETPYDPRSPYSASKAASDHLVRAYINTYGIKATISNCSNNFGPFCFPEKLIPLVITRAIMDEPIPVYGDGKQVRDWIHVEDHVQGIKLILEKGEIGETYMLGGNGERENIYIVRKILEYLGKPDSLIKHVGDRKGHDRRYAIDFSKAKKDLGFQPQKSIENRLEETIEWYKSHENWWKPLKPLADKVANKYLENA